jgi:hypothetical protein
VREQHAGVDRHVLDEGMQAQGERLDHYVKTLRLMQDSRPDLPFLGDLSEELALLFNRGAADQGSETLPDDGN